MARADVKDIDMGWSSIEKELNTFKSAFVLVGFQEGEVTKREVKGQRTKKGGFSMPEIAASNEFGTKNIPARPFMRTSFDENLSKINKLINLQYQAVQDGKKNADQALTAVGVVMVGLIQQKIRSIVSPPNSPRTIAIKGSSKPLIDFGQMIQSVREKVVIK
jgi:hypothetical protein